MDAVAFTAEVSHSAVMQVGSSRDAACVRESEQGERSHLSASAEGVSSVKSCVSRSSKPF